ncbi:hypothetical protein [Microbulbifer hydrolyticus]|uniref:Lipoprotein n=1 Tax=Microbulbifer hydrolyticus TaxID=48074 RepID=A0A6P1TFL6_9GAMM|nr:hypothetical protein [Microbulbifer hydrolyticus]MBB5212404.1 hypothetical protein [Microbulbifer hydrolyticus]QHQ40039.1 hypothetical protein GTQ55_14315 [Microbulbifer hydrolyticus]
MTAISRILRTRNSSRVLRYLQAPLSILALSVLTACGGGDGGGSGNGGNNGGTPPITPAPGVLTLSGDSTAESGDSVGIVASLSEQGYNRFQWEQLAGPDVEPLAGNGTAGISFDAVFAGSYRFQLTASKPDGEQQVETFDIAVNSISSDASVQLRADRAVSEGAQFSLRLNASQYSGTVNSWNFEQLSGPQASLTEDDSGQPVLFVTAPRVTGDQVLTFQATLNTTAGSFSDIAYVVVQDRPEVTSEYFCDGDGDYCAKSAPLNNVYSYRADSPYRDNLADCVYSNQLTDENLCTLGELPVIGMYSSDPTVDQVMDHVLVSHDWMGERFERFLSELDPHGDFARLLRATTAVVISSDVRPSFYWQLTGAIYLDPDSLWLTPRERDVINEQPDYRSGFGSSLNFVTPWRYVKGNRYAFSNYYAADRYTRLFSELEADLGSLMYHELAHANDALSPAKINGGLDSEDIFFNQVASGAVVNESVSAVNGLMSQELYALADVRYRGQEATAQQIAYTPRDISEFFFPDTASDFYSYTTPWEDTAMLFEETMMSLRYGIERDIAVTNKPFNPTSANDYQVYQGVRGRIGSERIRARASTAVQGLLPEAWADANAHLQNLTPVALCAGEGWGDNLSPACVGESGLLRFAAPLPSQTVPMPNERPRSFIPPTRF